LQGEKGTLPALVFWRRRIVYNEASNTDEALAPLKGQRQDGTDNL